MENIKRRILKQCEDFYLENDSTQAIIKAFFADEDFIQTAPDYSVKDHQWLIRKSNGDKFYIVKSSPIAVINGFHSGETLRYLTKNEYDHKEKEPSVQIGNIYGGAVIGNHNEANFNNGYGLEEIRFLISQKTSDEQEQLNELVNYTDTLIRNDAPITKGTFKKFSDILEKHSDIAIALMSSVFSWLKGN
ncbi:hypothetical protein [Carnobacterium maltaromaticum]|uniref:hypothetical protein n=1 Tax=Carnobacterium maltaromaticum TaxID=2751 RepID=UPI0012F757AC|nr:hypothetical protein [Carnobacterium maltaromaticum]